MLNLDILKYATLKARGLVTITKTGIVAPFTYTLTVARFDPETGDPLPNITATFQLADVTAVQTLRQNELNALATFIADVSLL